MGVAWTDFHYLTYGSGDDELPLIATTSTGSYLFYTGPSDRYFYAPIDLASGRLFAPPRQIDLGFWHRPTPRPFASGSPGTRGGVDVPINNRGCRETRTCAGTKLTMSGAPTAQGGVDAPIVNGRGAVWGAGSGDTCGNVILIIPASDLKTAVVVVFHNGGARGPERIPPPPQITDGLGDEMAASFLPALCN